MKVSINYLKFLTAIFSLFGRQGPEKTKFAEWPAEFSVYSRYKYKNFLLTKFLKIFQNVRAHQQFRQ